MGANNMKYGDESFIFAGLMIRQLVTKERLFRTLWVDFPQKPVKIDFPLKMRGYKGI